MKAPELKCLFHQGVVCMGNGKLHLTQTLVPGTEDYTETIRIWGSEAAEGPNPFLREVGWFCTISALYSWLKAEGAMDSQRNAMEAKRRPAPANPAARPTVPQRRARPPLMRRPQ